MPAETISASHSGIPIVLRRLMMKSCRAFKLSISIFGESALSHVCCLENFRLETCPKSGTPDFLPANYHLPTTYLTTTHNFFPSEVRKSLNLPLHRPHLHLLPQQSQFTFQKRLLLGQEGDGGELRRFVIQYGELVQGAVYFV